MEQSDAILIGMGKMGSSYAHDPKSQLYFEYISHAQVLRDHPNFTCVAAVDVFAKSLQKEADAWQIAKLYEKVEDVTESPHLAVIATPPQGRLEIIKALPNTIKAIILEKPLAGTLEESKAIVRYCKDNSIALEVNYWRRFDKEVQSWNNNLNKKIGALQAGFGVYGGGLLNNASHLIDCARLFCGEVIDIKSLNKSSSFVLHMKSGAEIVMQEIDFSHYREIYLDLWGETGRFELLQESLYTRYSKINEHRAISGDVKELELIESTTVKTGAGMALYNLYSHMRDVMYKKALSLSSGENALENEKLIHKLISHG